MVVVMTLRIGVDEFGGPSIAVFIMHLCMCVKICGEFIIHGLLVTMNGGLRCTFNHLKINSTKATTSCTEVGTLMCLVW